MPTKASARSAGILSVRRGGSQHRPIYGLNTIRPYRSRPVQQKQGGWPPIEADRLCRWRRRTLCKRSSFVQKLESL